MGYNSKILREGKIPPSILKKLLKFTARPAAEIIVGAETGEDAAVVRGSKELVVTADPITFAEENIGTYIVAVNCNDIVAMGGKTSYLTTTILLPLGTTIKRLETVFKEIKAASKKAGILWIGGHTEVTTAVNRIIVSAQAVGFLQKNPTTTDCAKPGELLVMTKWAGLEGSTLIARERPEASRKLLGIVGYRQVLSWLETPGISIVKEGETLKDFPVSAAHDPTEGGIATGIHEIASRSKVGINVFHNKIPVKKETELLCRHFNIDPIGLLSSGTLLFTCLPDKAEQAINLLNKRSIPAVVIGEINNKCGNVVVTDGKDNKAIPLPVFIRDEVIKLENSI